MNCRWNGRNQPRILADRHQPDCTDDGCEGCQECTLGHCRVCRRVHADGTCAECLAEVREALWEIVSMSGTLPAEAIDKGTRSEAAMLWGPVSDPEARQHVEASYLAGRLPEGWIEAAHGKHCPLLANEACVGCAGGELHPLTVLGTWQMAIADALEHELPDEATMVVTAAAYIDRQLTYLAGFDLLPFEDLAYDLRVCRTHLAAVLHDQNHGDAANIGCFECRGRLERKLTKDGFEDHWTCGTCHRKYTYAEYNFALRAHLEEALETA